MAKSVLDKLKGAIPHKADYEKRMAQLWPFILRAEQLRKLRAYKEWPVVESILTGIYTDTINEISKPEDMPDSELFRLKTRLEVIREIGEGMTAIKANGENARKEYDALKEKEDDRAAKRSA